MFLTLLHAIPCLYAQHVYKVEELGMSFEFPCIPEQDGGMVAVYDGYTYMHLFNCESGEDGFGIMALYIPDSRSNRESVEAYLELGKGYYIRDDDPAFSYEKVEALYFEGGGETLGRYTFDGAEGIARIVFKNGVLCGLFYMAGNRIDTKAWKHFSASLKMER